MATNRRGSGLQSSWPKRLRGIRSSLLYDASPDAAGAAVFSDWLLEAGTGGQTLTATRFNDGDTFGSHTVAPGAVTLTGTLYSDPDTFGAALVTATVTLTATAYSDPDTFGAATVTASYGLTGTLYADPDTFGAHTVTPGEVTLTATLYSDPDSFGAHTVSTGASPQDLTATLFSDGDAFGSHTLTAGTVTLTASLFADGDSFGAATVVVDGGPQSLTATVFVNASTFGAHTVSGDVVTVRRGDDAPSPRERFWRAKQDEWEEQALKRVAQAVSKPKKARKRFVADFLREIEKDAVAASFGPSRLDTVIAGLSQPTPDYTALAAVIAAQLAEIEAERAKRRRKRDLEALLLLAA